MKVNYLVVEATWSPRTRTIVTIVKIRSPISLFYIILLIFLRLRFYQINKKSLVKYKSGFKVSIGVNNDLFDVSWRCVVHTAFTTSIHTDHGTLVPCTMASITSVACARSDGGPSWSFTPPHARQDAAHHKQNHKTNPYRH